MGAILTGRVEGGTKGGNDRKCIWSEVGDVNHRSGGENLHMDVFSVLEIADILSPILRLCIHLGVLRPPPTWNMSLGRRTRWLCSPESSHFGNFIALYQPAKSHCLGPPAMTTLM